MTITVDKFLEENGEKLVGLSVTHNDKLFVIDKRIPIADGKTTEQYVADAVSAAQAEINAWKADAEIVGMTFDEDTNTLS
jgi:predicted transglutaminase-like protease